MPSDFLELLADDAANNADATALDRVRTVLFECLFHEIADERVSSLFAILGFTGDFDCYAIAGYPARSAVRTRKDIEKIVADFGGTCITADYQVNGPTLAAHDAGRSHVASSAGDDGTAEAAGAAGGRKNRGKRDDSRNAVVALVQQSGAATPEVICNTVAGAFAPDRPLAMGPQLAGAEGAMRSVRTALYCLKAAPALTVTLQSIPRPLRTDDALPERALIGDTDARDELVRVVYGSLTAAGPDDPTLRTVSTFLQFGGSLEATAKELNVHPNTIRYRLKRAAETTGWDATDPREAYVLTTAIALGHMAV
ncbi:PucR family transcriptional regulator [Bifidobacterium olomucense]|uniref:Polyketide synthase regulator n=1 Tax=Bifidobacterium olomucense TaxID=2675324 RepID=A0A7Y0EZ05_9BIFI|nr:helix-turn-helix domain-containing protein [Bifidobacterium sp. DSM 109959]NMM98992.1 polyketide synthase regulator [Bifidobacterium sp. DSM 109959]